ncbi:MAG TPA: SDR family NAD(P)-dependent oxidoreductase [bacterium]|nr:SDR family NAD(P)-dependent oxidoreductase [bacterium]
MKTLKDKLAVVTGAGSGIGQALAQSLTREGCRLALADRSAAGLKETLRGLKDARARAWVLDVTKKPAVGNFARRVEKTMGPADILVNNAGVNSYGRVADVSDETLRWMMDVNFWGLVHMTRAFLPQLLSRPESSLVNLSSALGLLGFYGQAGYSASKFAVRGFSEALAHELAGTSLKVTLVFPGGVKTGIHKASRNEYRLSPGEREKGRVEMESKLRSTAAQAAEAILRGIRRGSRRVLVGPDARLIDRLARFAPGLSDLYMKMAKKNDPFWKKLQPGH